MALSKAKKARLQALFGEDLIGLLLEAENVIVTEEGTEKSLADVLTTLAGKIGALIGSDTDKSARVIAGEVLAAAGKLTRTKVSSVDDIDPTAEHADEYIYMVPKANVKTGDKFDEYMVIDGAVEKVGDWEVNLSNYLQKVTGATAGNFAKFTADGSIEDSGKSADSFVEKVPGKGLSTNDYDDTEKQKVADSKAVTDKLASNADVLKEIDSDDVAAWNGKGTVYVSATRPANLKSGDLWLQTFSE